MTIAVAPIFALIVLWGTDALLLIMWAIIKTKGHFKSFQLFSLRRLGPKVSNLSRRVGVTSIVTI